MIVRVFFASGASRDYILNRTLVRALRRKRIGEGGNDLYQERFSEAAIAARLDECVGRLARAD